MTRMVFNILPLSLLVSSSVASPALRARDEGNGSDTSSSATMVLTMSSGDSLDTTVLPSPTTSTSITTSQSLSSNGTLSAFGTSSTPITSDASTSVSVYTTITASLASVSPMTQSAATDSTYIGDPTTTTSIASSSDSAVPSQTSSSAGITSAPTTMAAGMVTATTTVASSHSVPYNEVPDCVEVDFRGGIEIDFCVGAKGWKHAKNASMSTSRVKNRHSRI